MSTLPVPGARLFYQTEGSGPLLVMVPGAGGVGESFGPVAGLLAERYTVLRYDRRGFSRSRLDGEQDYDRRLWTDADDVRRLIEHAGAGPATVFGASSGAIVALAAYTDHPAVVARVVAYEPPLLRLLPDGQQWIDFFAGLYDEYRRSGAPPALARFRERTFPASDLPIMADAPRDDVNAAYWFEHELRQYPPTELDFDALTDQADHADHAGVAGAADRIVAAVGRDGKGFPCHDATVALAAKLGRPVLDLPGGHVGFHAHPAEFVRELVHALDRPGAGHGPGAMSPEEWNDAYAGSPHWDLGGPQPAFRALAGAGALRGKLLDVGCGTGEHVLMAARLGLDATGVDLAPAALRAAGRKARDRGLTARFLRYDARELEDLGESFDTVLDSGLFHIFGDEDRAAYVASVRSVLRPGGRYFVLCFSDRLPGDGGPRRITRDDITATFAGEWRIDSAEPTTLASPADRSGVPAWLITVTRI